MACSVCGETVDMCENEDCLTELEGDFHCYEEAHFCSILCWQGWLVKEERGNLKEAVDDEKEAGDETT